MSKGSEGEVSWVCLEQQGELSLVCLEQHTRPGKSEARSKQTDKSDQGVQGALRAGTLARLNKMGLRVGSQFSCEELRVSLLLCVGTTLEHSG